MFGFGKKTAVEGSANAVVVMNDIPTGAGDGVVNNTSLASMIEFPVPWSVRVQTPIKRPPSGKMWGNEIMSTYGGPWST